MKLLGPESYQLKCDPEGFVVTCTMGTDKFSGLATRKLQKLYIVSSNKEVLYVGATTQSMQPRLMTGWRAKGKNGYHGYPWRREKRDVELGIWLLESTDRVQAKKDIETIEAEVVYLVRSRGQWPLFQHEIHFHVSRPEHRKAAEDIFACYQKN